MSEQDLRRVVQRRYADAAREAVEGSSGCGCGCEPAAQRFYGDEELQALPEAARNASLGCANPTALADLAPGEVVLDLGSGGGIDVLLSARRVGPTGKVYGLDFTEEMLALARKNQRAAGIDNVEFLEGTIEDVPLPDASVDVIISNCVINLAADKEPVFREAFRVLRPGGRLAVADVVALGPVPPAMRADPAQWSACLAGALEADAYRAGLEAAGFRKIEVEPVSEFATTAAGAFASAFVRARKPRST